MWRHIPRILLVFTVVVPSGCMNSGQVSQTQLALATTQALVESLDALLLATRGCEKSVLVAVEATRRELEQLPCETGDGHGVAADERSEAIEEAPVQLGGIAAEWEERWRIVEQQADTIETRFAEVQESANSYWARVEAITAGIGDEELREREAKKNAAAKEAWNEVHEKAAAQIGQIQQLRSEGQDFLRVLQLAAMREDLGRHTAELESISEVAEAVLKELETLSEDGKNLIQSES